MAILPDKRIVRSLAFCTYILVLVCATPLKAQGQIEDVEPADAAVTHEELFGEDRYPSAMTCGACHGVVSWIRISACAARTDEMLQVLPSPEGFINQLKDVNNNFKISL